MAGDVNLIPQRFDNATGANKYLPFVDLVDSKVLGASYYGNTFSYNTHGFFYGDYLDATLDSAIGSMVTGMQQGMGTDNDDYAASETKVKVLDAFYTNYRGVINIELSSGFNSLYTPVTFDGVGASKLAEPVQIATNKFAILYTESAVLYIVIATISAGVITFGTRVQVSNDVYNFDSLSLIKLANDKFMVNWVDNTNFYVQSIIGTVAGTVPTLGTAVAVNAADSRTKRIRACALTATTVVIGYMHFASNTIGYVIAGTIAGTVPTFGLATSTSVNSDRFGLCKVTSTKFAYASDNGVTNNFLTIYSVSGTTITAGNSNTRIGGNYITHLEYIADNVIIGTDSLVVHLFTDDVSSVLISPSFSISAVSSTVSTSTNGNDLFITGSTSGYNILKMNIDTVGFLANPSSTSTIRTVHSIDKPETADRLAYVDGNIVMTSDAANADVHLLETTTVSVTLNGTSIIASQNLLLGGVFDINKAVHGDKHYIEITNNDAVNRNIAVSNLKVQVS